MTDRMTGRRDMLTLAAGATLLGAAAGPTAASGLDVQSAAGRLRVFMLMRGALDGRLVIGGSAGSYYGIVDSQVTPLFGFVSATFARYRPAPGGGFEGASYEVPFFTDIATGAVLEHWRNPYTGETVAVPQPATPPARIVFAPDLTLRLPDPPAGLSLDHSVQPPLVSGDDVWMVEQTLATIRIPGLPAPAHFTEIVTLHASRAALSAPGANRVPCLTSYQGIGGWRQWQRMGALPGSLTGNGYGRYGLSLNELPAGWQAIARARRPEVLDAPDAPLARVLGMSARRSGAGLRQDVAGHLQRFRNAGTGR